MNLSRFSRAAVTLCEAICLGTPVNAQPATDPYSIVKMADGVYGFVWADQTGPEPNMLIVVNDEDVLLVDSSMYPSDARAVVSEIRKLTPKPVRYLVNTHWHDDHLFGNSVIQEPGRTSASSHMRTPESMRRRRRSHPAPRFSRPTLRSSSGTGRC